MRLVWLSVYVLHYSLCPRLFLYLYMYTNPSLPLPFLFKGSLKVTYLISCLVFSIAQTHLQSQEDLLRMSFGLVLVSHFVLPALLGSRLPSFRHLFPWYWVHHFSLSAADSLPFGSLEVRKVNLWSYAPWSFASVAIQPERWTSAMELSLSKCSNGNLFSSLLHLSIVLMVREVIFKKVAEVFLRALLHCI